MIISHWSRKSADNVDIPASAPPVYMTSMESNQRQALAVSVSRLLTGLPGWSPPPRISLRPELTDPSSLMTPPTPLAAETEPVLDGPTLPDDDEAPDSASCRGSHPAALPIFVLNDDGSAGLLD